MTRLRDRRDRLWTTVNVDVVGQDVDCGGGAVLANRRRVDERDWRMVNRPDGHVDRGGRATVQGVGEDVAAIEVRIRREGQAGASARDGNCAMTRLRDRHDRLWTTVDVDVVGQDVDCGGAAVSPTVAVSTTAIGAWSTAPTVPLTVAGK